MTEKRRDYFLKKVTAYFQRRKFHRLSLEEIQKEIDDDPENIEPYLAAARLLLRRGDFNTAKKYIDDAMELNPENPDLEALLEEHGKVMERPGSKSSNQA